VEATKLKKRSLGSLILVLALGAFSNVAVARTVGHTVDNSALTRYAATSSTIGIRLGIDKKNVGSGGTERVRIENVSNRDVAWGYFYELARWQEGKWLVLPPHHVFAPRLVVRAGTVGEWQAIPIPPHVVPGLYRIRKWVEPVASGHHQRIAVKATFQGAGSSLAANMD
jgi:hypothetical protein